jgi:phosphonate transport system substrate-binding protein
MRVMRALARLGCCALVAMLAWQIPARAQAGRGPGAQAPIRFGVLPVGGAVESRDQWTPLLADMSRALGRPVTALSVTSYEALDLAIRDDKVDMALLSAQLALNAVSERRMRVLAQVERQKGESEHRAVLLARKAPPFNSLKELLARPERWRLARGDTLSMSGFILPQVQLFLPNRIAMETRFLSEIVGTHQATALAVANGDADVATNNTTDFERFRQQFPVEAGRLQVIWRSEPTPRAQFVARRDYPPELREKLRAFLAGYGRRRGAHGDAEREVLRSLHAGLGYVGADDASLLPAAKLEYQLARQRALVGQWVSQAALDAKLKRLDAVYAEQVELLRGDAR